MDIAYHDLRKEPIDAKSALAMARTAKKVYGYTGKKETIFDMKKDKPDDKTLTKILVGRSGTLRAPCLKVGDTFVGGFNEDMYKKLLKV